MNRIVITEKNGKHQASIQAGFFIFWRTISKTKEFTELPSLFADLAGFCAKVMREKYGSRYTRQQRRQLARIVSKSIG